MKIQAFITTTFLLLLSSDQAFAKFRNEEQNEAFAFPSTKKRLVPKQILAKNKQPTTHLTPPGIEAKLDDFERNLALAMKDLENAFGFGSISIDSKADALDDDTAGSNAAIDPGILIFGLVLGLVFPPAIPFILILWLIILLTPSITLSPITPPTPTTSPTKFPTASPTLSVIPTSFPTVSMAPSTTSAPSDTP